MKFLKVIRAVAGALCWAGLSGCSGYQPAPLSFNFPLKSSAYMLKHTLPDGTKLSLTAPVSLTTLGALAILNNPDLIAVRAQHGIAQAELFTAGLLPDPTISGGFAALVSGPGSIPAISGALSEDISALITYSVNRRAAKAGLAQVDAQILWQEWQTAGQAEALSIAINAGDQTIASLRADQLTLSNINRATTAQLASHNLTIAAASASASALAANQMALNSAIQTREDTQDQLDALLGLQPGIALPVTLPMLPALQPAAAEHIIKTLPEHRPDLIALRYGYAQADDKLRAAILAQFLPISLGGSAGRDTSNVWSAGPQLSLTLPLFNRNRGGIASAKATRQQLAAQFQASLAAAEGGAEALLAKIPHLAAESTAATAAAASARDMAKQSNAAFNNGTLDAVSAANLTTAASERAREAITLSAQLMTARLALDTLLGAGLPAANLSDLEAMP
ncbi:MAG: TolC family protein [Acidocella sp.]|nr:TolC family protein [Acidocella sp.]